MSTRTGALRVPRGYPSRVWRSIATALLAAVVVVSLVVMFSASDGESTAERIGSGPQIGTTDRANPGREPAGRPSIDRVEVGGETTARFHPLP